MSVGDLSSIRFSSEAFAAFASMGQTLDSILRVAQQQTADLRQTLRQLISLHPTSKADVANLNKLKAILAELT
jgi:hypothetical protein